MLSYVLFVNPAGRLPLGFFLGAPAPRSGERIADAFALAPF